MTNQPLEFSIHSYDKYIVAFSGGKDSIASFLQLLELGVPKNKIELWHHEIDGRAETFMDWEVTTAYCQAFADAFNVPIYFSWKMGGFKREMLRLEQLTAPIQFETPDGTLMTVGGKTGKPSTRLKFPQVSPDLSVRWCSAYLKIDVCSAAIRNQSRFDNSKTLVISGERAEESPARSKYAEFEPDRADNRNGRSKRHVDRFRAVKLFSEKNVWELIGKYKIRVHPAYYLGFGRVSCKFCIFGNANQFATAQKISPSIFDEIAQTEEHFGTTIKRNLSITELALKGTPYAALTNELAIQSSSDYYDQEIFMDSWILPAGAYGESCGSV